MASAFQPRFVDLVRNYTITVGTGAFVPGPAVTGFSSFSSALQPGDRFYYSAIGVDKPNEREVGRGTLQANGTISREPISGVLTSFTAGSKTIALIAAAEWYSSVQTGAAGAGYCGSRAELRALGSTQVPMLLTEDGREGLFVFDPANRSAQVAKDSAQGIFVAPSSDTTGASGAWVRKFSGPINVRWFGATGGGSADDSAAFVSAIAIATALGVSGHGFAGAGVAGPRVFVPSGVYFMGSTTIELTSAITLEGESGPVAGTSVLKWAAGATGIRAQYYNTSGATGVKTGVSSHAGGSVIRNLTLEGGYTSTEAECHGIQMRVAISVRDCFISNFQGDGIYIVATSGGGVGSEGNANCWEVTRTMVASCRNGLFVSGADANAGRADMLNAIGNRAWGVNDNCFLGNTYQACHAATNRSGPYRSTNVNARNALINCYSEGDQPPSSWVEPAYAIGGLHGAGWTGSYVSVGANSADPGMLLEAEVLRYRSHSSFSNLIVESGGMQSILFVKTGVGTAAYLRGANTVGLIYNVGPGLKHAFYVDADNASVHVADLDSSGLGVTSGSLGYRGGGGAVVQATSKSTPVTLNKASGQITLSNAALAAGAKVTFAVSNNLLAATDTVIVNVAGGGTANAYRAAVTAVAAGSFALTIENMTTGSLAEAPVLNFAVLKAVNA